MFFIVNKTKEIVVIGDIGVTLGPKCAADLDKLMSRDKSESSKMIKAASRNGQIDIRIKDGGRTSKIKTPEKINDFDDFKKEILEEMKRLLNNTQQPTQQQGLSKEDLAVFTQQIISSISKSETVTIQGQQQEVRTDEDVDVGIVELGEMNKRIINKIVENVESVDIKYKEEIQKNDLDNNVSELEGFLGK